METAKVQQESILLSEARIACAPGKHLSPKEPLRTLNLSTWTSTKTNSLLSSFSSRERLQLPSAAASTEESEPKYEGVTKWCYVLSQHA